MPYKELWAQFNFVGKFVPNLTSHKERKPVAYGARGLTGCENIYAQIEKECLRIAYGCEKFHHYIFGLKSVLLERDHKPLIALSQKSLIDMTP